MPRQARACDLHDAAGLAVDIAGRAHPVEVGDRAHAGPERPQPGAGQRAGQRVGGRCERAVGLAGERELIGELLGATAGLEEHRDERRRAVAVAGERSLDGGERDRHLGGRGHQRRAIGEPRAAAPAGADRHAGEVERHAGPCEGLRTVAWSVKRFIGRMPNDDNVARAKQLVSYSVEPPPPGGEELVIKLGGKPFTPVELSAEILRHIVAGVEKSLRQRPTHAVITVPAYFTERQKAATQKAGELAGLGVLGILDEPTAAALAYGIDLGTDSRTVLVFDLGGGTFDVSVLMLSSQHSLQFRIGGDNFLGGDDFDNIVLARLLDELPAEIRREPTVIAQLKSVAEDAKIALSTTDAVAIDRFLRTPHGGAPLALSTEVTRAWFQQASRPLVDRVVQRVRDVLADARLGADDIHRVLMVGGSSRLPAVMDAVSGLFGAAKVDAEIDGMLCVALGAAVRASQLEPAAAGKPAVERPAGEDGGAVVVTVTPRPIGVELHDGTLSVLIAVITRAL